jgi:acyl carrier protein
MVMATSPVSRPVQTHILRVIRQRKHLRRSLHLRDELARDLHFDTLDVVDVILALEQRFHLTIPDDVPLRVVGDLVHYVAAHLPQTTP